MLDQRFDIVKRSAALQFGPFWTSPKTRKSLNIAIMIEPHCLIEAEHIAGLCQAVFVEPKK